MSAVFIARPAGLLLGGLFTKCNFHHCTSTDSLE